jgi:hypothetical protein
MITNLLEYPEYAVYRAVTGQASVFPRALDGVPTAVTFPVKGTIPLAHTNTGTISSTGVEVRGTGTAFETELRIDDYLYDNDNSVRRIIKIESDTKLVLNAAFPANVTGIAVLSCARQEFKVIQVENSSENVAELQEAPFAANSRVILWGAPIAYDALTGQISFTVSK